MVPLDTASKKPMYEQIYEFIKKEIKSGNLKVHTKLPSTRKQASFLQVSRNTVDLAYHQLLAEGYIESVEKSGYYVAGIGSLIQIKEMLPIQRKEEEMVLRDDCWCDFTPFGVDISAFPFSTWRRLSNQCMNDMNQGLFLLGDNQGELSLRREILKYLSNARGVHCREEQIIVGAGADYLLQLLSKLIDAKSIIAMENPAYRKAYQIFTGMGFFVEAVPVEKEGIDISMLRASTADVVYVTPSHQYPLGVVMPIKRKRELLSWAGETEGRFIIEDDHDSEFRYKGKPIPALQGMDSMGKVIYLGTFSRAIAPAIRIGYMVLPKRLIERYNRDYYYYSSTVSRIDQAILCEFIRGGYFERHVNKMRGRYKAKHDAMIRALKRFGDKVKISGENAGLHLTVEFQLDITEKMLIQRAKDSGILLYGLSGHYIKSVDTLPSILLGYAHLTEAEIEKGINGLFDIL